jgi:type I restriction enzyme M protein
MKLYLILKDSNYKLSQFKPEEITDLENSIFLKQTAKNNLPYINGVLLLQTKNINEFFIKNDSIQKINSSFHQQLKKSQVKYKNILIARSGSFGKASIYLDKTIVNSADIIILESNNNIINSFYLVAFLNSQIGVSQLLRFASGGLQGHVNLTILENLLVPILKSNFQKIIELIITKAYSNLELSKQLYQEAEELLLTELGLKIGNQRKIISQ